MSTPAASASPQSSIATSRRKYPPFFWPQIIPYLTLLVTAYFVFTLSVDDPYITFRYAANLLAGHGAVYNIGDHVEGFSSPLHLMLCVLLLKIVPHADILFKAKLLSLAFGLIGLRLTWDVALRAHLTRGEAIIAQLLVALNIGYALAAVNGLETTLYTCVVLATVLAFLREESNSGNGSALWLVAAVLTRPDAVLLFIALLLLRIVWAWRGSYSWRSVLEWASFFIFPVCLLLLVRLSYYGVLMPNTYYAKGLLLRSGIIRGYFYLSQAFAPWTVGFASFWTPSDRGHLAKLQSTGAWFFWGLAVAGSVRTIRQRSGQILSVLVAMQILFILRVGGDWMEGWRFMVPIVPLIAILQCHSFRMMRFFAGTDVRRRPLQATTMGLALAVWCAFFWLDPHLSWGSVHFTTQGKQLLYASRMVGQRQVVIGDYIKRSMPPGASIAYSEMGYAGYTNMDKRFIDTCGLTDRQIAQMPTIYKAPWGVTDYHWYQAGDPLYNLLQQKNPDAIIVFDPRGQLPRIALGRYVYMAAVVAPEYPRYPALVYLAP